MPEQLPCPSKTCGIRKAPCGDLKKVVDSDDLPCSGLSGVVRELREGFDRSAEGPSVKPKNKNGELSLEELRVRQQRLQEAVDKRVDEKGERVTKGVPPCEDALGRPVDRFGRPIR